MKFNMSKLSTARALSVLVLASVSGCAHAGLLVQAAYVEPPAATALADGAESRVIKKTPRITGRRIQVDLDLKLTPRIFQSEPMPADVKMISGSGVDVSLDDALRQIVPRGWEAYADSEDSLNKVASWSAGNKPWPIVLDQVLETMGLEATIDWASHSVEVYVAKHAPAKLKPEAAKLAAAADQAAAAPVANQPKASPKPPEKPVFRYVLKRGAKLSTSIQELAREAGWSQVIWNTRDTVKNRTVDYVIEEDIPFSGDIVGVNGIIARIISAYRDAERPLAVEFFEGNKVIEVTLQQRPSAEGTILGR